jgi:hypothetical protein
MDLLAAVGSARAIANFVEGGELANALADLGLAAARDALSKIPYANAKTKPVESAINHLEAAEAATRDTIQNRGTRLFWSNEIALVEAIHKRRYILALMALCYRYLGEQELTRRTLSMIPGADEGYEARIMTVDNAYSGHPRYLVMLASPRFWASAAKIRWQMLLTKQQPWMEYKYDISSFQRRLTATWEEGPPDLLNFR